MMRFALRIVIILAASAAIGIGYGLSHNVPLVPDVKQIEQKQDARAEWMKQTAIDLLP